MAKLTNIVTRSLTRIVFAFSALLMSVLLIAAFTMVNCAWADVVEGETAITVTNDTYTYKSSSPKLPVILTDSTLILDGALPNSVTVHGDNIFNTIGSPGYLMNVYGDGNITYKGGMLVDMLGKASYTGSTTVISGIVNYGSGIIYDLASADDEGGPSYRAIGASFGDLTFIIRNGSFYDGTVDLDSGILTICNYNLDCQENAALKLCCESDDGNYLRAASVFISSGRVDIKGILSPLTIEEEGIFSPGNSIGAATIGVINDEYQIDDDVLGDLTIESAGTLLMEIGGSNFINNDLLTVTGNINIKDGAIIELALADSATVSSVGEFEVKIAANNITYTGSDDETINIMSDEAQTLAKIKNALHSSAFPELNVRYDSGAKVLYISGRDPNAVPEPSTWALLVLGTAGLLYLRKREKK